ncbi:hypothetical protein ABZO31_26550 [Streptomyces sp. HUAS MG47]|uniref:hypothetical protein n=1 Tax=Streptomyces solicamelliae TaxID=3231716 RepID=UPI0038784001
MIVMHPVLEDPSRAAFPLWPVVADRAYGFLPLGGGMSEAEIGTAVMLVAACNDLDPGVDGDERPPRPADPVGSFLHGLLTFDTPFASGGLRVTDTSTGIALVPGAAADWRTGGSGTTCSVTEAPGSATIPIPPLNGSVRRCG